MIRLLRARAWKYIHSVSFWVMIPLAILGGFAIGETLKNDWRVDLMYAMAGLVSFMIPVLLTIGRESSDGGFRSKIVTGGRKWQIFLTEMTLALAVTVVAVIIITVTATVVFPGVIVKMSDAELGAYYKYLVVECFTVFLFACLSVTAVSVAVGMLVPGRLVAVINIVLVIVVMFGTVYVKQKLDIRQYRVEEYITDELDENGNPVYEVREWQNPDYVGGVRRRIYQAAYDVSPYGQFAEYGRGLRPYVWYIYSAETNIAFSQMVSERVHFSDAKPVIYSVCVILLSTLGGAVVFGRKDQR